MDYDFGLPHAAIHIFLQELVSSRVHWLFDTRNEGSASFFFFVLAASLLVSETAVMRSLNLSQNHLYISFPLKPDFASSLK